MSMSLIELCNFKQIVLACENGLYGVDCRESCGHCHDVNQCSNINGTCLAGCDAGYEGVLCKRRKWLFESFLAHVSSICVFELLININFRTTLIAIYRTKFLADKQTYDLTANIFDFGHK